MIGTISSGISFQQRDIFSIYTFCWDVAMYKWKVHSWEPQLFHLSIIFVYENSNSANQKNIFQLYS